MEFFQRLELLILEAIKTTALSSGLSGLEKTDQASCYNYILTHVRLLRDEYRANKLANFAKPTDKASA